MEQLFSKLGCDVRQTLHHITGLLELVAEEPLSRNQVQYLAKCRASADHLVRTANDLGLLMDPGETPGAVAAIDIRAKVDEIAGLMQALATRKGLEFSWAVASGIPNYVVADGELVQDSLRRILDNAIRFTTKGRITLAVTLISCSSELVTLEFEITDTGPGIPQEVLSNFESGSTLSGSGGLGLLVVRKRLSTSGGSILVTSHAGHGTTVRLSIPAHAAADASDRVPSEAGSTASWRAALRLLVAEDSDDSFLLLQMYLRGMNCHIVRALNGAQAVEMAQASEYHLIVMDANMPVMNGYDATRTIREWETTRDRRRVPILLISADDLTRQTRIGAVVGCSGYLTKPTTKAEVLEAIQFFTVEPGTSGLASL